jgi:hypothetical protein
MATAYYSKDFDAKSLFKPLSISNEPSFETHLNKYNVIFLNIQNFLERPLDAHKMVAKIKSAIFNNLKKAYPSSRLVKRTDLVQTLHNIAKYEGTNFVFIIDEWDCIFRVFKNDIDGQKVYLDFLRLIFKDQSYVQLAYMTGILPIKKYGTHSALNMFNEFSMANPAGAAEFVGFTDPEVKRLCDSFGMSYKLMKEWYDGYVFKELHIYSPLSVVKAISMDSFTTHWGKTETYEALKMPLNLNFDGLKDAVLRLMAHGRVAISTAKFQNDLSSFSSADDVLTLLVHLGYLAFDSSKSEVFIPNNELREEFKNAVEDSSWAGVSKLLLASRQLVNDTLALNAQKIESAIQGAHNEHSSILKYNDENSLCCVVSMAYYSAFEHYIVFRELASRKGYIDMLFLPKPLHLDKPALLVELKCDKTAKGAIAQVKEKNYSEKIQQYTGKIILVGINYDRETKTHTCMVEEFTKP